jgi:hypothetical protein
MRQIVGILVFFGLVMAIALLLGARSPRSDVISSEIREIDPNTPSLDISGPSSPQQGWRINLSRTPALLILRCPMLKPVAFKTVYTAMKQYKEWAAPGGRCGARADFAEHSRKRLPRNLSVSRQFADYRLAVADGASPNYDAATGRKDRYGRR